MRVEWLGRRRSISDPFRPELSEERRDFTTAASPASPRMKSQPFFNVASVSFLATAAVAGALSFSME
jgi:hypothetical protein